MIERADRWLLERLFEPVAHFCERGFGLTNFMLARFCVILLAASDATRFWQDPDGWQLTVLLASLTITLVRFSQLSKLEGMIGANSEKHLRPMAGVRMFYVALLLSVVGLGCVGGWSADRLLMLLGTLGFWAHMYFSAADRPPPIEEKNWAWRTREA